MRSARQAFRHAMGRNPGKVGQVRVPVGRHQKALPAGALFHYWHPDRDGAETCPDDFRRALHDVSPDLECVRPPAGAPIRSKCWLVWWRCDRVKHWLSPGWLLILAWHAPDGTPLPLDNRVFANLYMQSARAFGGGKEYFESIVKNMRREHEQQQKDQETYRHDRAKDLYQSTRISSAGKGNRFALHHDGTILPSRGERNWLNEIADSMLPGSVVKAEKDRQITHQRKSTRY